MLQQEVHIKDLEDNQCSHDDEQWWWSEDHQEVQDTRLQVLGFVQQEGNN